MNIRDGKRSGPAWALLAVCGLAASASAAVSFGGGTLYAAAQRPGGVAVGDFDRDGDNDVAVSLDNPDRVVVYVNNGAGTLSAGPTIQTGSGTGPDSMVAADFDRDCDIDLAVVLNNTEQVRILLNNGSGAFTAGSLVSVGAEPRNLAAADIDGDGDLDLATANRDDNTVTLMRNAGGALTASTLPVGGEPRAVAFGDANGGGGPELFVTNHDDRTVRVYANSGGTFSTFATYTTPGDRPGGIDVADVTGDGVVDFVTTAGDRIWVFRGAAGGTFGSPTTFSTAGSNPDRVILADFDGDGDRDVAVNNEDTNTLAIFDNNGSGSMAGPTLLATGAHPDDFGAGALRPGGPLDLVSVNRDSNNISVFLNAAAAACRVDYTGDGLVDFTDYLEFLNLFDAQDPRADLSGDGVVDFGDYLEFLNQFDAEC